jgi:hypothetical protein
MSAEGNMHALINNNGFLINSRCWNVPIFKLRVLIRSCFPPSTSCCHAERHAERRAGGCMVHGQGGAHMVKANTTRNRPLEHQIFWQHHVFGCNSWFYSNQRINALRYLGVMATKNVGCVC